MNNKKLRAEMLRYGDKAEDLARVLKISRQSLSKRQNKHVEFSRSEIEKIANRYSLSAEQVYEIFFAEEVSQSGKIYSPSGN